MNMALKNKTSVARNAHIPKVAASFCCGISSNCSCNAAWVSAMTFELLLRFLRRILIRRLGHDGDVVKIMLQGRGCRLPFESRGFPGIGGRFFPVLERPDEI